MRRTVVLLALGAAVAGCGGSHDDKALVVQECKDSVQAHLNYDADFPLLDPNPSKDSSGTWHVSGTVTAQNGFGAKRTLRWTCTVDSDDNVQTTVSGA